MGSYIELISRKSSDLFYSNGFVDVPVERIIEYSGVSRGTFYKYFSDKEGAVCAALEYRGDSFLERMAQETAGCDTLRQAVEAVFGMLIAWHREKGHHGCLFQSAASEFGSMSERVRVIGRAHKRAFERQLAALFEQLGCLHAGEFARTVTLLIEGAVALGNFSEPESHIDRARGVALQLLDCSQEVSSK